MIDENHVLGIGRDANSNGLYQQMQVSLFDITDPTDPKLKRRYSFEDGITSLGSIEFADPFNPRDARSMRIGDALLTLSPDVIQSHVLRQPDQKLDELRFSSRSASIDPVVIIGGPIFEGPPKTAPPTDPPAPFEPNAAAATRSQESGSSENAWHNLSRPMDVDGDGEVRLLDLLRVINFISRHGASETGELDIRIQAARNNSAGGDGSSATSGNPAESEATAIIESVTAIDAAMVDINNDGRVTPKDILQMVNHFGRQSETEKPDNPTTLADSAVKLMS